MVGVGSRGPSVGLIAAGSPRHEGAAVLPGPWQVWGRGWTAWCILIMLRHLSLSWMPLRASSAE